MDAVNFAAILSVALLGSFGHCVGMCGGFVAAYSSGKIEKTASLPKQLLCHLTYHFGRIFSYACLGALCGLLGRVLSFSPKTQGFLLFVLGLVMILMGVSLIGKIRFLTSIENSLLLSPRIRKIYQNLITSKSFLSLFCLGVFNGFVPCGLVYFFAASAVASGSVLWGAVIMALFGLSTLPAMIGFGLVVGFFTHIEGIRDVMIKCAGVIVLLYGIYLSYRGYIAVL